MTISIAPLPLVGLMERFTKDTGYTLLTGGETEFYLSEYEDEKLLQAISASILAECINRRITIGGIEKEKGKGQFEIWLPYNYTARDCPEVILHLRDIITKSAQKHGVKAYLESKPFPDQPGNGLHFHLCLRDANGQNPLMKRVRTDSEESPVMRHAIGGLLATLKESMIFFAPTQVCYSRYVANSDAPTNISWGGNNRTTAIRIPASTVNVARRHIEHRVSSGQANPRYVMAALIAGIHYGITHKIEPGPKIFGNAFDEQYKEAPYNLEPLPASYQAAFSCYQQRKILLEYAG